MNKYNDSNNSMDNIILFIVIFGFFSFVIMIMFSASSNKNKTDRINKELTYINLIVDKIEYNHIKYNRDTEKAILNVTEDMDKENKIFFKNSNNSIYYQNNLIAKPQGKTYITYYKNGYYGNLSLNYCIKISSMDYPINRIYDYYKDKKYYVEESIGKSGLVEEILICF